MGLELEIILLSGFRLVRRDVVHCPFVGLVPADCSRRCEQHFRHQRVIAASFANLVPEFLQELKDRIFGRLLAKPIDGILSEQHSGLHLQLLRLDFELLAVFLLKAARQGFAFTFGANGLFHIYCCIIDGFGKRPSSIQTEMRNSRSRETVPLIRSVVAGQLGKLRQPAFKTSRPTQAGPGVDRHAGRGA